LFDILTFLANPLVLILLALPTLIFIGIWIGVWLSQPRKNRVYKIDPTNSTGIEYEVESQDTVNAYCKSVGNTPPQRFITMQNPINFIRNGVFRLQNFSAWFARIGTAYTQDFNPETKELKNDPVTVPLRVAIENLFGKDLYDKIPNDEKTGYIKDKIEKSEIGVMIKFPEKPLTPNNMSSISPDDIRRHDVDNLIKAVVQGVKMLTAKASGEYLKIIFILGTGIAIGVIGSIIFHLGWPTVVTPKTGTATSAIISIIGQWRS
jgi:preprotein translocase subunit Sss1